MLPLVLVFFFLLLGPVLASTIRGAWSALLLTLSWALAVALGAVVVKRLSRPEDRREVGSERPGREEE